MSRPQCSRSTFPIILLVLSFSIFSPVKVLLTCQAVSLIDLNICSWRSCKAWTRDVRDSGDYHWIRRHEQQRSLQMETVDSTECFIKAEKPEFFPEGKIDSCAVYRDLHLHGCSCMLKETPTNGRGCSTFQQVLNHSTIADYQAQRCVSISECSVWRIRCCASPVS